MSKIMRSYITRLCALSFFVLSMLSCGAGNDDSKFKVIDSGVTAINAQSYWIDNNKVIFIGAEPSEQSGGHSTKLKDLVAGIYIWDIGKGITRYADSKKWFCYDNNYISYQTRNLTESERKQGIYAIFKEGELYKETEKLKYIDEGKRDARRVVNQYTCQQLTYPPELEEREITMLRPEHGYIDEGPRIRSKTNNNKPVSFVNVNTNERITLPILRKYYQEPNGYYKFKEAYFIWSIVSRIDGNWRENDCKPAWWLYPDGRLENVCVPVVEAAERGSTIVYPFKNGNLLVSNNFIGSGSAGKAGIYLMQNGKTVTRILPEIVGKLSTSPNGCKVAFPSARNLKEAQTGRRTLKIINFCEGER